MATFFKIKHYLSPDVETELEINLLVFLFGKKMHHIYNL